MRGGRLDRSITIERKTATLDDYGQPIETWSELATVHAEVRPLRGDERFTARQFLAQQFVEFFIRYSSDVSDLSPLDRIVYPVVDSPDDAEVYDIAEVSEIGRREGFKILATRRAET